MSTIRLKAGRHALPLVFVFIACLAGCASGRDISVSGDPIAKDTLARPDVPEQISEYLHGKGQHVTIGPAETTYDSIDLVVSYVELWGWDLGPIIKTLKIEFLSQSDTKRSIVEFCELTFFNSQPTAKSLVPQMLDRLFGIAE